MPINQWREDERPRERLLRHGAAALSDAELLAIMIAKGTRGFSALDAARELLTKFPTLADMSARDVSEIAKTKGIGQVKAITLAAAFELSRRIESAPFQTKTVFRSPQDIAAYYIPRMRGKMKESFHVMLLNTANQIFREVQVSEGSLNASIVHPREVFRLAISESAASIVVLHNHPTGNTEPSREDIAITKQLADAGNVVGIKLLDHLIIAGDTFTSFVERGLM
ncbi:MAG: DNA repair protein RadC [Candidatus Kapabacteria bacterium]|nr:DNA repair protein RadC [Candidatus Kapabacteria bacterium]